MIERIISGADGCRDGWVVVSKNLDTGEVLWCYAEDAHKLIYIEPAPVILTLDIPIGLTDAGPRQCDLMSRSMLGQGRGSSVFPAPIRPVLSAKTYEQACRVRSEIERKKMSKQAYGIMPKIRDIDEVMSQDLDLQNRVYEIHPEMSFYHLAGSIPLNHNKKSREGHEQRVRLLEAFFGCSIEQALADRSRLHCSKDDIIDAFAALWTAERILNGKAVVIPLHPQMDEKGLFMRIVS